MYCWLVVGLADHGRAPWRRRPTSSLRVGGTRLRRTACCLRGCGIAKCAEANAARSGPSSVTAQHVAAGTIGHWCVRVDAGRGPLSDDYVLVDWARRGDVLPAQLAVRTPISAGPLAAAAFDGRVVGRFACRHRCSARLQRGGSGSARTAAPGRLERGRSRSRVRPLPRRSRSGRLERRHFRRDRDVLRPARRAPAPGAHASPLRPPVLRWHAGVWPRRRQPWRFRP